MKAFRFRLATLERVRRKERDEQRRKVAEVSEQVEMVRRRLDSLTATIGESLEGGRSVQQVGVVNVETLMQYQSMRAAIHRQIEESEAELIKHKEALASQRELLVEASRRLKVIEKLREKKYKEFLQEQSRLERIESDEIANVQFVLSQNHTQVDGIGR